MKQGQKNIHMHQIDGAPATRAAWVKPEAHDFGASKITNGKNNFSTMEVTPTNISGPS